MKIEIEVVPDRIRDLLVNAFESGSKYWISEIDYVLGDAYDGETCEDFMPGRLHGCPIGEHYTWLYMIPLAEGCSLQIFDDDEEVHSLDLAAIEKGLKLMAATPEYAHHFGAWVSGDDDANTGDVFLQLCLFGKVVYG